MKEDQTLPERIQALINRTDLVEADLQRNNLEIIQERITNMNMNTSNLKTMVMERMERSISQLSTEDENLESKMKKEFETIKNDIWK